MKRSLFAILLALTLFTGSAHASDQGSSTNHAGHGPNLHGVWAWYCEAQSAYSGGWTWWAAYNLAWAQNRALVGCNTYYGGCFLRGCRWRYIW